MREEEFDALIQARSYGTEDAKQADLRLRRNASLATILWGKTPAELRRQLMTPSPEVPSGFDLADFQELLRTTEQLLAAMRKPQNELMARIALSSQTIVVGTKQYTEWEARCEIIRRAIEYLENR